MTRSRYFDITLSKRQHLARHLMFDEVCKEQGSKAMQASACLHAHARMPAPFRRFVSPSVRGRMGEWANGRMGGRDDAIVDAIDLRLARLWGRVSQLTGGQLMSRHCSLVSVIPSFSFSFSFPEKQEQLSLRPRSDDHPRSFAKTRHDTTRIPTITISPSTTVTITLDKLLDRPRTY